MLAALDKQTKLTGNQRKLLAAAMFGIALEFLDYFLIGFVLTFLAKPWNLTFGISAIILLSSGIGAIIGGFAFGRMADVIGRRITFLTTIAVFTLSTLALVFTPNDPAVGWLYLTFFRFLIGLGAGGLYCVDLPLVQEFVPTSKRGFASGLVTATVPVGFLGGSLLVAYVTPMFGGQWQPLMWICFGLGCCTLFLRSWIPESPRYLLRKGDVEGARKSVAWALEVDPKTLPLTSEVKMGPPVPFSALLKYPGRMAVTWLTNLGAQTGYYGLALWAPALIAILLHVSPKDAGFLMIFCSLSALVGRVFISVLSEAIGRRWSGVVACVGTAAGLLFMAFYSKEMDSHLYFVMIPLCVSFFFGDGSFAIVGPYAAEVWPSSLRTTGMGSAYGFGGIGKIIGPLGLAVFVGTQLTLIPKAGAIPIDKAFIYFAVWYVGAAVIYFLSRIETRGRSIEAIDLNAAE